MATSPELDLGEITTETLDKWKPIGFLILINIFFLPDLRRYGVYGLDARPQNVVRNVGVLFALAFVWLGFVSTFVPGPYLDEIFHIPQAQKYCEGKFREWDNKITTPPGLYIFSILAQKLWLLRLPRDCSAVTLRNTNTWAITFVGLTAAVCRHLIEMRLYESQGGAPRRRRQSVSMYAIHTGFNIALFPVLFFFSGLYYTDIVSTLAVLASYWNHLARVGAAGNSIVSDVLTVVLGLLALFMRQTNVFWVVVYMGGAEVIHAIKTLKPEPGPRTRPTSTLFDLVKQYAVRYGTGAIHDPPMSQAGPEDVLFCAFSLCCAAVENAQMVFRQVWPYVAILGVFTEFVASNGGVVLGDKSNHVATLHLAQMLYIWPLVVFFSAPMVLPSVLSVLQCLYLRLTGKSSTARGKTDPPARNETLALWLTRTIIEKQMLTIPLLISFFFVALLIIRFNTIIHPFTLADNRHYMFYVFRYSIRRPGLIRFLLAGPYVVCAWLACRTLSTSAQDPSSTPYINRPFALTPSTPVEAPKPSGRLPEMNLPSSIHTLTTLSDDPTPMLSVPLSTSLLLLLTTTLSLVTAPLVEPRYFILPWVMWRLLLPAYLPQPTLTPTPSPKPSSEKKKSAASTVTAATPPRTFIPLAIRAFMPVEAEDPRLALETAWFLVVNVVTMYVFLVYPYQWRAEDGTLLDEGRLQRFMW